MPHMPTLWYAGLVALWTMATQPVPPELSALAAKARLDGPVAAWCGGQFRPGHAGAFAVAVTSASGGGRYVVIEADAKIDELSSFTGAADLSCYTRAEAEQLDLAIARTDTVHGHVAPRWSTTVVCAFVDATTAACWQLDPDEQAFVRIGGWVT